MSLPSKIKPLADVGVVAVVRAPDPASAVRGVEALVAGGVTGIEITYSTPEAPGVIAELSRRHGDGIVLGAGTVLTSEQVTEAAEAGARFLVSPGSDDELAEAMRATGLTMLLGALTPSEVMHTSKLGADAVKIFPASLGGPSYVRALRGPFPDVPFIPTGGVSAGNLGDWLSAGAFAVGAGGDLCSAGDLAAGRWDDLEGRARQFSDAMAQWRRA
jgi:2-dehydro-3-deoxyphosphogluconate aldolase / (4S)-4-hydroxy-2-oxoglutarate aldolase